LGSEADFETAILPSLSLFIPPFNFQSSNIYGSYSGRHFDYGYGYSEYSRGDFYRDRGPETGGEGTSFGGGYYGRDGQDRGTLVFLKRTSLYFYFEDDSQHIMDKFVVMMKRVIN